MSAPWEGSGHPGVPMGVSTSSNVWSSRTPWGAILAGAVAGFGALVIMATLGTALGITAGMVGAPSADTANSETAEKAGLAFGFGTATWMLLSAAVSGLVGGSVLNSTSRRDRPYSPVVFGGITWAAGVCMLFLVVSPAIGGALSGFGSGAGGAAAALGSTPEVQRRLDQAQQHRKIPSMSEDERATAAAAAKKGATAATIAAWVILASQLMGLGATIFAAGWHRHVGIKVVTELRPRPVPVS
jgi:hypothetical protein